MRSVNEIQAQIDALRGKDKQYNNLVNEGGEGFERNSVPKKLINELMAARELEFEAKWTLDFFNEQRAIWNKEVLETSPSGQLTVCQLMTIQNKTGIKKDDLAKAKKMLGLS